MGMDHGLNDQTDASRWEEARSFVKNEVKRVTEQTKPK